MHYEEVGERQTPQRRTRDRRLGRRLGIGVFATLVGGFTVVCSVQICLQVWAPRTPDVEVDCATGTLELIDAVLAARSAASREVTEQSALAKFRGAVAEAWSKRPTLGRVCQDTEAKDRLRKIDRLRYAEEHAVRYRAAGLSRRRHAVQSLMPAIMGAARSAGH